MQSFPQNTAAIVIGATGGIGNAIADQLEADVHIGLVVRLGRATTPSLDLTDEGQYCRCHDACWRYCEGCRPRCSPRLRRNGVLHGDTFQPEKALRDVTPEHMAHAFALNALGPALLMKHALPLLPKSGKSVFATLSARVGSIGDNRLGGWYSYRASKSALNQFVRCAAIENARRKPDAIVLALHPGTVDTGLSVPFTKSGLSVQSPAQAAEQLLSVIDNATPEHNGGFMDYAGEGILW